MNRFIVACNGPMDTELDSIRRSLEEQGMTDIVFVEYAPTLLEDGEIEERLKFFRVFLGFKRWFRKPKAGLMAFVACRDKDNITEFVGKIINKKLVLMFCEEEKTKKMDDNQYLQKLAVCDFIEGVK